jgi:hypothetical protein
VIQDRHGASWMSKLHRAERDGDHCAWLADPGEVRSRRGHTISAESTLLPSVHDWTVGVYDWMRQQTLAETAGTASSPGQQALDHADATNPHHEFHDITLSSAVKGVRCSALAHELI